MKETSHLKLRSDTSLPAQLPVLWFVLQNLPAVISKLCANAVEKSLLLSLAALFHNMIVALWLLKKIMGSESWVSGSFHSKGENEALESGLDQIPNTLDFLPVLKISAPVSVQ